MYLDYSDRSGSSRVHLYSVWIVILDFSTLWLVSVLTAIIAVVTFSSAISPRRLFWAREIL